MSEFALAGDNVISRITPATHVKFPANVYKLISVYTAVSHLPLNYEGIAVIVVLFDLSQMATKRRSGVRAILKIYLFAETERKRARGEEGRERERRASYIDTSSRRRQSCVWNGLFHTTSFYFAPFRYVHGISRREVSTPSRRYDDGDDDDNA